MHRETTQEPRLFSNRDLWKLILPLVGEQMLSGLMGIADTMMVTRVGDTAISAVSCVDAVNNVVLFLLSALATGGTIICAQYLGRRDRDHAVEAAGQVYLVSFSLSLLLSVFILITRRGLLKLIFGQVEEEILSQAVLYMTITAFSYPFLALQQTSAAQFRAGGNGRLPMLSALFANSANIVGNAILIFIFHLGVAGAAVSTLLCRVISAMILLICQRNVSLPIPFRNYRSVRPRGKLILSVCRIAIPTGLENGMFQLGRLLVQSTVATLGTTAIAAQAMTTTLDSLHSMPSMAIGTALLTIAGQCMGAGRVEEAEYYTKKLCVIGWVLRISCGLIVVAATPFICRVSGLSEPASQLAFKMMSWIVMASVLFWVAGFVLPNTMRAAGDVTFCAVMSAISMWIFRVAFSAFLCRRMGVGLEGIWIAWFTDWAFRMVCYIIRYKSGAWKKKRVLDPA